MSLKTPTLTSYMVYKSILCIYDAEKHKISFTLTFPKIEMSMFSNFS